MTVHNVDPTLTGTSGLTVNEGQALTLTGLGVGFTDPGFDNPNNPNPADPANNIADPTHETLRSSRSTGATAQSTPARLRLAR